MRRVRGPISNLKEWKRNLVGKEHKSRNRKEVESQVDPKVLRAYKKRIIWVRELKGYIAWASYSDFLNLEAMYN